MGIYENINDENIVFSKGCEAQDIRELNGYYVKAEYTVNTPSAVVCSSATDINASTDIFTQVAHGLLTGLLLQATTSSALPTGLSLATDYYIIKIDADTFKLATSLANALAQTAINITDVGTGDQTFTPVALAGASIKLQGSAKEAPKDNDWDDVADSSIDISASGVKAWNVSKVYYMNFRYYVTLTSGQIDIVAYHNGKRG